MRIYMHYQNLWGEVKKREMQIVCQSNDMMIATYCIGNLQQPLFIEDVCVLENGYTAVCFIEYGKWYITEKIFNQEAEPMGFLARLVTPVEENIAYLKAVDLFVRLWVTTQHCFHIFGTRLFKRVSEDGLFSETVEKEALETTQTLISQIKKGMFPPELVRDFEIEKRTCY